MSKKSIKIVASSGTMNVSVKGGLMNGIEDRAVIFIKHCCDWL